jgi:hypothetical protein
METLASILAGAGANPYQMQQGIAPLLSQILLSQQLAQGQLGQGQQPQQGAAPAQPQAGLGSMGAAGQSPQGMPGAAALPYLLAGAS